MLGFDDCREAGDVSDSKGVSVWETEGSKLRDGLGVRLCGDAESWLMYHEGCGDGSRVCQSFHVWLLIHREEVCQHGNDTALSLCASPGCLPSESVPIPLPRYSPHCSHPGTMSSTPFLQHP